MSNFLLHRRTNFYSRFLALLCISSITGCSTSSQVSTSNDVVQETSQVATTIATQALKPCTDYLTNYRLPITYCEKGTKVTAIQERLVEFGASIEVDGYFGQNTVKAVKSFQARYSLPQTGNVDFETWNALQNRSTPRQTTPNTQSSSQSTSACSELRALYQAAKSETDYFEYEAIMNEAVFVLRSVRWGITADNIVSLVLNGRYSLANEQIAGYLRTYNCP
jgi:peptidoglycan hydrolase-like protein with peptidoglycan-binding domain